MLVVVIALVNMCLTVRMPQCVWGQGFLFLKLSPSLLISLLLQLPLGVGKTCSPQWGLKSCATNPEMTSADGLLLGEFVSLHYLELNEFPFNEIPNWSFSY